MIEAAKSTPAPVLLHGGSTSVAVDIAGGVPRMVWTELLGGRAIGGPGPT